MKIHFFRNGHVVFSYESGNKIQHNEPYDVVAVAHGKLRDYVNVAGKYTENDRHDAYCQVRLFFIRSMTMLRSGETSIMNMYAEKNQYLPHTTGKIDDKSHSTEKLSTPCMHRKTTNKVMPYIHTCA